jgi:pantothenate kinase
MDETYKLLAEHLLEKLKETNKKIFVGIAGSPGSGKSTISTEVSKILNDKISNICVVVPMDGFHYYKEELNKMEDVENAYKRRGSPFTFNSSAFFKLLKQLKENNSGKAPSFDHKIGDPIEEDIIITEE